MARHIRAQSLIVPLSLPVGGGEREGEGAVSQDHGEGGARAVQEQASLLTFQEDSAHRGREGGFRSTGVSKDDGFTRGDNFSRGDISSGSEQATFGRVGLSSGSRERGERAGSGFIDEAEDARGILVEVRDERAYQYLRPMYILRRSKADRSSYVRNRDAAYMFSPMFQCGKAFSSASLASLT